MKTIVLDDDPTGTQSTSNVRVLLDCSVPLLTQALSEADAVYVQTNTRALSEPEAVALLHRIREQGLEAGRLLTEQIRFVLRGDSTLRGHVLAESEVFLSSDSKLLFVPAFPVGGRTTRSGIHHVRVGDHDVPAHLSEYAQDPVFPFDTSVLTEYMAQRSERPSVHVPLASVRDGRLDAELRSAPAGAVVIPDAVTDADVELIAEGVARFEAAGGDLVVRCAAPLAAELAGVRSAGLLEPPLVPVPMPTLLVCGSHTHGATAQLEEVTALWGEPALVNTAAALADPAAAGVAAAGQAHADLLGSGLAVVTTERHRSSEHGTLEHGHAVMSGLVAAVQELAPSVAVVISKGGITSAEVARSGLGATSGWVLGQVLPGVSAWRLQARDGAEILYVVVPGNVGDPRTLVQVLSSVDCLNPTVTPS